MGLTVGYIPQRGGESVEELVRLFLSAVTEEERAKSRELLLAACPKVDFANPWARPLIVALESANKRAELPPMGSNLLIECPKRNKCSGW